MSWCHLCNCVTEEAFYIDHLSVHHPMTLFVMYAMNLTPARMGYVNTFHFYLDQEEEDNEGEYEMLLALCNEIGDHKIGIEDISKVSSIVDRRSISMHDTCPICLEAFIEKEDDICMLNACNHSYCEECIRTWCLENRICPVCKTDVV
jgi:hypothetical protein